MLPYVRAVHSRIQKREYFDIAMDSLRIGDAALRRELWHSIRGGGQGVRQQTISRTTAKPTIAEERLLEMLLADAELRSAMLPKLEPEDYDDLATAPIFRALIEAERAGAVVDFEFLSQQTEGDPIAELIPGLLMSEFEHGEGEQFQFHLLAAERCIDAMRLMKTDRRINELRSEIAAAERSGETERCDKLAIEQIELTRRRDSLLPKAEAMQSGN